jgi:hypothetical protein
MLHQACLQQALVQPHRPLQRYCPRQALVLYLHLDRQAPHLCIHLVYRQRVQAYYLVRIHQFLHLSLHQIRLLLVQHIIHHPCHLITRQAHHHPPHLVTLHQYPHAHLHRLHHLHTVLLRVKSVVIKAAHHGPISAVTLLMVGTRHINCLAATARIGSILCLELFIHLLLSP